MPAGRCRPVCDFEDDPRTGQRAQGGTDRLPESAVEDKAGEAGVRVEIRQLSGGVAVVHVDRHGPDLETGDHGLDVLGAVGQLDAHPITRPHSGAREVVGQAIGPLLQFRVGRPSTPGDHGRLSPGDVDDALEEVGKIELHGLPLFVIGPSDPAVGWCPSVVFQVAVPPYRR